MADISDFLANYCINQETRPVNNKKPAFEAVQAEVWIWEYFKEYYRNEHGSQSYVVTGLSYLTEDFTIQGALKAVELIDPEIYKGIKDYTEYFLNHNKPQNQAFNIVLKWLRMDFRNIYSKSSKGKISMRSGGFRKPDILGIHIRDNKIILELLEITTIGQELSTIKEDLESKKEILEKVVIPLIEAELRENQFRLGKTIAPNEVEVVFSKWKPKKYQLFVPLLNMSSHITGKFEWICYKPTLRNETDGLILYEIHSSKYKPPRNVTQKISSFIKSEQKKEYSELRLMPRLNDYLEENKNDLQELKQFIALGAGISLVITIAFLTLPETSAGVIFLEGTAEVSSASTISNVSFIGQHLARQMAIADKVVTEIVIKGAATF